MTRCTPTAIRVKLDLPDRDYGSRVMQPGPAHRSKRSRSSQNDSPDSLVTSTLSSPTQSHVSQREATFDADHKHDATYRTELLLPAPDMSIVSQDKVVFAVHGYKLEAASPILQAKMVLFTSDAPRRLVLNGDLETANNIRFLLNVLYGRPNPKPSRENLGQLDQAIQLAEAWQSHQTIGTLLSTLFRYLRIPNVDLFDIFRIASHRSDWQLCAEAIERSSSEIRQDGSGKMLEDALPITVSGRSPSNSLFHVTAMPYSCVEKLSLRVVHALNRAHERARDVEDMTLYCQMMAQEFLRQIDV